MSKSHLFVTGSRKAPRTIDPVSSSARSSRATGAAWLCTAVLVVACGRPTLLPERGGAPPDVQEGCSRTELKCSSCHSLDRILNSHRRGRVDWEQEVKQMRLKPGSGIS